MSGIAYLIGAGPGDPGLITVKGKSCIERADVIIYDYLADERLLQHARADATLIYAGKKAGAHTLTQEEMNALLVEMVADGHVVARLKGGDPFVFGRGGEEALALVEAGLPFEVVPGVTSAIAAPAYAGIPVTHRAVATSFAVVTGHEDPTKPETGVDWEKIANGADTLTFVMGLGNLPQIMEKLIKYGRDPQTPAAVVRWGTKPEQRTVVGTIATLPEIVTREGIKPPGLLIVGEVVRLRDQLRWIEDRPLFGQRIVVTRARHAQSALSEQLERLGATIVPVPAIRMQPTDNRTEQAAVMERLDQYDWLLFTSVNTVRHFFAALYREGRDARNLPEHIMAIGKKTAVALATCGIVPDFVPENASAEGMLSLLATLSMEGVNVLLPRAKEARDILVNTLEQQGATVDVLPVYETLPDTSEKERLLSALDQGEIDVVTFTSSSTVRNILGMIDGRVERLSDIKTVAIGEVTAETMRSLGLPVTAVAREATIESLVEAVCHVVEEEK